MKTFFSAQLSLKIIAVGLPRHLVYVNALSA